MSKAVLWRSMIRARHLESANGIERYKSICILSYGQNFGTIRLLREVILRGKNPKFCYLLIPLIQSLRSSPGLELEEMVLFLMRI